MAKKHQQRTDKKYHLNSQPNICAPVASAAVLSQPRKKKSHFFLFYHPPSCSLFFCFTTLPSPFFVLPPSTPLFLFYHPPLPFFVLPSSPLPFLFYHPPHTTNTTQQTPRNKKSRVCVYAWVKFSAGCRACPPFLALSFWPGFAGMSLLMALRVAFFGSVLLCVVCCLENVHSTIVS